MTGNTPSALFSWDTTILPQHRRLEHIQDSDDLGNAVLKTLSRDAPYEEQNFWNHDRKWAGIFKMDVASASPAYFGAPGGTTPMDFAIAHSDFGGITIFGITMMLVSLPLIRRLLGRRQGRPFARLSFYDCGKSGGFMVPRRRMLPPEWIPRLFRRAGTSNGILTGRRVAALRPLRSL